MGHKLFLTSVVAFFPLTAQLPVGMVVAITYYIIILRVNPYLRSDDDALHCLAQTELFLLLLAGDVFASLNVSEYTAQDDIVMSICLIVACLLFVGFFAHAALKATWAFLYSTYRRCKNRNNQGPAQAPKPTAEDLDRKHSEQSQDDGEEEDGAEASASAGAEAADEPAEPAEPEPDAAAEPTPPPAPAANAQPASDPAAAPVDQIPLPPVNG